MSVAGCSRRYSPDFGMRSSIGLALQNLRSGKVDSLRGAHNTSVLTLEWAAREAGLTPKNRL